VFRSMLPSGSRPRHPVEVAFSCQSITGGTGKPEDSKEPRNWIVRVVKFVVFAALIITVLSLVLMRLWNWLTPVIFGWHVIKFWPSGRVLDF